MLRVRRGIMTVKVSEARIAALMDYLKRGKRTAPTNRELALKALRMGQQRYQPWDRMKGIRSPKPEHGAVVLAAAEMLGLVLVERGSNWRRITIMETGDVLEPARPRLSC